MLGEHSRLEVWLWPGWKDSHGKKDPIAIPPLKHSKNVGQKMTMMKWVMKEVELYFFPVAEVFY